MVVHAEMQESGDLDALSPTRNMFEALEVTIRIFFERNDLKG